MFRILIRGRDCANLISKCLSSLQKQTDGNWKAYLVLDNPKDNTERIAREYEGDTRIAITVNERHLGLCQNMWNAMEIIRADNPSDEDVVCILDADDWLHRSALAVVGKVYDKHPECWFTYGSYIKVSKGSITRISKPYPDGANVRRYKWHASHLKTIKWLLLKRLRVDAFMDKNGNWFKAASDVAMTIPLMEMAGLKRCRHIHKCIYFWRDKTVNRTKRALQKSVVRQVRAKPALKRIKL